MTRGSLPLLGEIARSVEQRSGGVTVDAHVITAPHVAAAILELARGHEVDVIAMCTRGELLRAC